jgi:hypothetical protein
MIIIAYIWIFCICLLALTTIVALVVEKNFAETHPIKKWWRRNIVAPFPEDLDPNDF